MVTDEGTSYELDQDSKVHGHVRGVGEDKSVRTNEEPDVEDEEWHQVKHKIKGNRIAMQRDTKSTNAKALSEDNLRMNEGFKKIIW